MPRRMNKSIKLLQQGNWKGSFPGTPYKTDNGRLYSGYSENIISADQSSQTNAFYIGTTSYPATPGYVAGSATLDETEPGRLLVDIMISIVRKFLRTYYPQHSDVESADQVLNDFQGMNWGTIQVGYVEPITGAMVYSKALASNGTPNTSGDAVFWKIGSTNGFPSSNPTTTIYTRSIRQIGYVLAREILYYFRLGYEPRVLIGRVTASDTSTGYCAGIMNLNQVIVRASVKTTMTLQNQTVADDGDATGALKNTTIDISANPIHGRLYYFKGLTPLVNIMPGGTANTASNTDYWALNNLMTNPSNGRLQNVLIPTQTPSESGTIGEDGQRFGNCWMTLPKPDYFKNITHVKNVTLEPGHQKSFSTDFHFNGYLTTFLTKDLSIFNMATNQGKVLGYDRRMGNFVLAVFEKRIRSGTVPINIAWQNEVKIKCDCIVKKQAMAVHVETDAS